MRPPSVRSLLGYRLIGQEPSLLSTHERWRKVAEALQLSRGAKTRLTWMIWYEEQNRNALATARHFGITPKTFWKWRKRFSEANLRTLEEAPRTPRRKRSRQITPMQEQRIVGLKKAHIRWGKQKIAYLYREEFGETLSSWKVQKVIEKYKLYYHPIKQARTNRKRAHSLKKKRITELKTKPLTGFLLCLDTIVLYWNGTKRYVFTAIDRHAKLAFARVYTTKSSLNAKDFLQRLHWLCEGKITNVGHDNGSEFKGYFVKACKELGIEQYHSRVRTPKDNATNERFNRTLQEEFIQMGNRIMDPEVFNRQLTEWLVEYNFKRPHQSLGYMSPINFIYKHQRLLPMYPSHTLP